MTRSFFDEYWDLDEYQNFRKREQHLEREHLALRQALREAETALQAHPEDQESQAKVEKLRKALGEMEAKAPWINTDYPVEYLLWGPPHG